MAFQVRCALACACLILQIILCNTASVSFMHIIVSLRVLKSKSCGLLTEHGMAGALQCFGSDMLGTVEDCMARFCSLLRQN